MLEEIKFPEVLPSCPRHGEKSVGASCHACWKKLILTMEGPKLVNQLNNLLKSYTDAIKHINRMDSTEPCKNCSGCGFIEIFDDLCFDCKGTGRVERAIKS